MRTHPPQVNLQAEKKTHLDLSKELNVVIVTNGRRFLRSYFDSFDTVSNLNPNESLFDLKIDNISSLIVLEVKVTAGEVNEPYTKNSISKFK